MSEFILFRGNVPMIARCIACQGRGDISAKIVVGYRVEHHPTLGELQRCYCAAHAPEPTPAYLPPVEAPVRQKRHADENDIAERITLAIAALDKQHRVYTALDVHVTACVYQELLTRFPEQRARILAAVEANKERLYVWRAERTLKLLKGCGPLSMTQILREAGINRKAYQRYAALRDVIDHAVLCSGGSLPRRAEVA